MSLQGLDQHKVDGSATQASSFNRDLDHYTVTVTGGLTFRADGQSPALDSVGDPIDDEQYLFNKMIEVVSLKAQPILLAITGGTGTGRTVFTFVTEHSQLWQESGNTAAELLDTVLTTEINLLTNDADVVLFNTFAVTITYSAFVAAV